MIRNVLNFLLNIKNEGERCVPQMRNHHKEGPVTNQSQPGRSQKYMPINICLIYPQRETPFIWTSVLIKTLNSLFHKTAQQNPRTLRWWGRGNDLRSATLSPLNQTGMTHALEKQLLITFSTSRLTMWGYNNNAKKNMNVNAMQCAASARPDQAI